MRQACLPDASCHHRSFNDSLCQSRTEIQYTLVLFGMNNWVASSHHPFFHLGTQPNVLHACTSKCMYLWADVGRSRRRDARPRQPSSYATLQSENPPRCVITGPSGNKQVQTDKDRHAVVVGQDQSNMKR
ncbi:hypothetical protein V8C44DRAFT_301447 [Trichoderma aethiopicum]